MTRPIYEPSLPRQDAFLDFQQQQLYRRPAPVSAGGTATEFIKATSTTDLGTGFTALDWVEDGASCYDTVTPTFAINASGNLEVGKDGMYDLYVWVHDQSTTAPNQTELLILRGYRNAGATPEVLGASSFVTPREVRLLQRADDATLDTGNLAGMPDWYTPMVYFDGDIGIDGVTEIEFEAYTEINNVGTATSDVAFSLFCRIIGPPCIPAAE